MAFMIALRTFPMAPAITWGQIMPCQSKRELSWHCRYYSTVSHANAFLNVHLPGSASTFLAAETRKQPADMNRWRITNFKTATRGNRGILFMCVKWTHWEKRHEDIHIQLGDSVHSRHKVKLNQTVLKINVLFQSCKEDFFPPTFWSK